MRERADFLRAGTAECAHIMLASRTHLREYATWEGKEPLQVITSATVRSEMQLNDPKMAFVTGVLSTQLVSVGIFPPQRPFALNPDYSTRVPEQPE